MRGDRRSAVARGRGHHVGTLPGSTEGLIDAGGLVDAYRRLHPHADWTIDSTWRGAPGVSGPPESGRYYNKGMRIDYVLVASSLAGRITRAHVHGHGPERAGFLGSDHCPLLVTLRPPEETHNGTADPADPMPTNHADAGTSIAAAAPAPKATNGSGTDV